MPECPQKPPHFNVTRFCHSLSYLLQFICGCWDVRDTIHLEEPCYDLHVGVREYRARYVGYEIKGTGLIIVLVAHNTMNIYTNNTITPWTPLR